MAEQHFEIWPLDTDLFVKRNDCKEITDPVAFNNSNAPSPDGLLSNQIFGITKEERAGIFGYIDLGEYFISPLHYRIWSRVEPKVKQVVHGTTTFKIDSNGLIAEDPDGETGAAFLKKNLSKLSFGKGKREDNIAFLKKNKDTLFIRKFIVIPPFYRDVNSEQAKLGLGEINKLYQSLIIAVRALKESQDYGLTLSDATRGRIQEIMVQIYDWFGAGTEINGTPAGGYLPGKLGVIRRNNMSKTTDYSTRLVISAPQLKVEKLDDLMVDPYHAAVPLASALVNYYPYILFFVRRFFENEFAGRSTFTVYNAKEDKIKELPLKDWQIYYSDTMIKKQIDRFIHGYSNRFIPIEVPVDDPKTTYLRFKGRAVPREDVKKIYDQTESSEYDTLPIMDRNMTWCDLFFMAACVVSKDKVMLATRFPMDSYFNQYPTEIVISSTKDTEPMYIPGHGVYKFYPKIRQEDMYTNTTSKFIETLIFNNTRIGPAGGDYDGDQMGLKPLYTKAANAELKKFMHSKAAIVDLSGTNVLTVSKEGIQTLYNLTMCPDDSVKFTDPVF